MSELSRFVIGRRIAEKARAPLNTPARNALAKAKAALVKAHGGDALCVSEYDAEGNPVNGLTALQRGEAVTLKLWLPVRESSGAWDDPGEYRMAGETVVRL